MLNCSSFDCSTRFKCEIITRRETVYTVLKILKFVCVLWHSKVYISCIKYGNVCKEFRFPLSEFAMVAGKFLWQIYSKILFSDRGFYVTIIDTDIEKLKSLLTLFGKYLDYILVKFEQNCIVRNIQNFDKKLLSIFEKVLMPFFGRQFCDRNKCLRLKY